MSKPFKFRYVNELSGIFVLMALLLIIVGIFFAGNAQAWFEPKHTVFIRFPSDGLAGLKVNAEVQILETQAGRLERIIFNEDGSLEARLVIRGDFIRYVKADSMAIIRKKFAVAGDSFIEITRGSGADLAIENPYISCKQDEELTAMVTEIVENFRSEVLPLVEQTKSMLAEYEKVALSLTDPEGHIQQILKRSDDLIAKTDGYIDRSLQRVNNILFELQSGDGTMAKLINDPATADQLLQAVESMQQRMDETAAILADVKIITENLKGEAPELTRETLQTLEESRRTIEGLQNHWLLRSSMPQTTNPGLIAPDSIREQP